MIFVPVFIALFFAIILAMALEPIAPIGRRGRRGRRRSSKRRGGKMCGPGGYTAPRNSFRMTGKKIWLFRTVLLVTAVVMIFVGVANGEDRTVLQKAVNICLECIGIG